MRKGGREREVWSEVARKRREGGSGGRGGREGRALGRTGGR